MAKYQRWKKDEDQELETLYQKYGTNWHKISSKLSTTRTAGGCASRYAMLHPKQSESGSSSASSSDDDKLGARDSADEASDEEMAPSVKSGGKGLTPKKRKSAHSAKGQSAEKTNSRRLKQENEELKAVNEQLEADLKAEKTSSAVYKAQYEAAMATNTQLIDSLGAAQRNCGCGL